MTDSLDVNEVAALLVDEHDDEVPLRPKALHKILYFAERELDREHISVTLPQFWYMYGAMVATSNTAIQIEDRAGGNEVVCETRVGDIDAPGNTRRRARRAVNRALERYYDLGIEGLTDKMYKEAPYDAQRCYRRLDQQLEAAADDEQMTLWGGKNEQRTRETLYEFVECFPLDEFPAYEDDLHIWYRLMSAQLDAEDYDPAHAQTLAKRFWRLFCLELACRENNGLSREEIAQELGVESVEVVKERIRADLIAREREKARQNARDSNAARKAAEAFVVPHLEFDVRV